MRTLDICLVTTFYPPWSFGGDAIFVESLAHALADDGHRVTVVHCRDAYRLLARHEPDAPAPHDGVRVVSLHGAIPHLSPAVTYLSGRPGPKRRALERLFSERRFDVTHFHNISLLGPDVLRYGGGVKVLTLHEHWLVCPMHVLWKDNRELCVTPSCVRCCLRFRRPPQPWRATGLLARSLACVDAVIAPSAFVLAEHARRGLMLERASVLPYFVSDPGRGPASPREPRRFAFVGRLEPIKGVLPLIEAFRRAPDLELVVAGTGSLEGEARALASELRNVTVLGRVDHGRVGAILSSAAALVVPSVGYEVGPVVAIEAFAHGTAVVGRRLGGLAEHLAVAGALTFERDDEIVPALTGLAADPTGTAALGVRARACFEARHTARVHLSAYYDLVDRAPTARRRGLSSDARGAVQRAAR